MGSYAIIIFPSSFPATGVFWRKFPGNGRARLSSLERRLGACTPFLQTGKTSESCSNGLAQHSFSESINIWCVLQVQILNPCGSLKSMMISTFKITYFQPCSQKMHNLILTFFGIACRCCPVGMTNKIDISWFRNVSPSKESMYSCIIQSWNIFVGNCWWKKLYHKSFIT